VSNQFTDGEMNEGVTLCSVVVQPSILIARIAVIVASLVPCSLRLSRLRLRPAPTSSFFATRPQRRAPQGERDRAHTRLSFCTQRLCGQTQRCAVQEVACE
jgi:hypothetical protein